MGDACAHLPALPPCAVIVCSTLPFVGVVVVLVVVQVAPVIVAAIIVVLVIVVVLVQLVVRRVCYLPEKGEKKTQSETIIKIYKYKKYFSNRAASVPTCFCLVSWHAGKGEGWGRQPVKFCDIASTRMASFIFVSGILKFNACAHVRDSKCHAT